MISLLWMALAWAEPEVVEEPTPTPVEEAAPSLVSPIVADVQTLLNAGIAPRMVALQLAEKGKRFTPDEVAQLEAFQTPEVIVSWARHTAGMSPPSVLIAPFHCLSMMNKHQSLSPSRMNRAAFWSHSSHCPSRFNDLK